MEVPKDQKMERDRLNARLVAKTSELNLSPVSPPCYKAYTCERTQYYKSLQWSAEGTAILASLSTNTLATYLPPPDLLSPPDDGSHQLTPYSTHSLPEPSYATAIHPSHDLQNPSTCLALASLPNLPLRLFSTLYNSTSTNGVGGEESSASAVLASYPLVSPTTEAYLGIHSLAFGSENWVYAGSEGKIAAFDLNRPGEAPAEVLRTGKSRNRHRRSTASPISKGLGDVVGIPGLVSALTFSCEGLLAAGTFGRGVGIYDGFADGKAVATFSLEGAVEEGTGVTQVLWSDCGKYLSVVERGANGIGVWDIRGLGKRVAWLRGRHARTPQRLMVESFSKEIWAGGTDGIVRVWDEVGAREGDIDPSRNFEAHRDAVSGIGLHSSGTVLATSSGQRHFMEPSDPDPNPEHSDLGGTGKAFESVDSTLKLWAL